MKLKQLKKIIDNLSDTELEQEIVYNSKEHSISGVIKKVKKQGSDLLWNGEDDPSEILTRKEWKERGYEKEEIDEMDIEIKKGQWVLWL